MIENIKINCIHCSSHIGTHYGDGGVLIVPLDGKAIILRARLNKVFDGFTDTCIGSYINTMSIRFKCLNCEKKTSYECSYEEDDYDDWD